MDMLAIFKAVGARSSDLLRIFCCRRWASGWPEGCWASQRVWQSWQRCRLFSANCCLSTQCLDFPGGQLRPDSEPVCSLPFFFAFLLCWTCARSGRFWYCDG